MGAAIADSNKAPRHGAHRGPAVFDRKPAALAAVARLTHMDNPAHQQMLDSSQQSITRQQAVEKESGFSTGYMAGFHRVMSSMRQQAEAFDIPLEESGTEGIDADEDLV